MILTVVWIMAASSVLPSTDAGNIPSATQMSMKSPGDVVLGASFPIHGWTRGPPCTGSLYAWGHELLALFLFAIDNVNGRSDVLPNLTIGYDIRDNCYSETLSIWTTLSLASTSEKPQEDVEFKKITGPSRGKLFSIIGTQSSTTSIPTAQAASLYRIPVISPFATSNELSNKKRFPYFLRTVPPDILQASAMADILLHFGWTYFGIYFQLNSYGIHGAQGLLDLVDKLDLCVAFSVPVRVQATQAELIDAVDKISQYPKARVIILFADSEVASEILVTIREQLGSPNVTFIGSDGWPFPNSLVASGVLLSQLHSVIFVQMWYDRVAGFEDFYRSLQEREEGFSPWFEDLQIDWLQSHNCSSLSKCPIPIEGTDNFLVDAVYAFAHGLDDMLMDRCGTTTDCNVTISELTGNDLLPHLMQVRFSGLARNYSFDKNGNPGGRYKIVQIHTDDDVLKAILFGTWDADGFKPHARAEERKWIGTSGEPPVSVCRDVCQPGYVEVPLEEKCCFGCQRCSSNAIVANNTCESCAIDEWPDNNFIRCHPIIPTPPSWDDPLVLAILTSSGTGIFLSGLAALGLYYYRGHVLIKAASRELSSINILGLTLAFLSPFPLLVPPTDVSCRASEIILAMCFAMTYAPTLLKVNRIFRIFDAGKKSNKPPRYIGQRSQLTIVLSLIAIMVVVTIIGTSMSPSVPAKLFFFPANGYIEAFCQFGNGFLASITCNLLLILACCYYAFKARKVPSNYNESKFIAVSVYSTLVFGLAAVPVYITAVAVLQKVATLCVAILLNSLLTLFCVYLPKLYAIQLGKDVEVMEWRASGVGSGAGSSRVTSNTPATAPSN